MATVVLDGPEVVVRLTPLEKLGALRGDVRVPRTAVRAVRVVNAPAAEVRGVRLPGTAVPGVVALGTWRRRRSRDFVAVRHGQPGLVIELDPGQAGFARLVVSVPDPEQAQHLLGGPSRRPGMAREASG